MVSLCQATIGKCPSSEFPEQAGTRQAQNHRARCSRDVRLVTLALLHESVVVADGDAPVFELASVAVDRPQLHHHLVRVEVDHYVSLVFHDQRQLVVASGQAERVAVKIRDLLIHREVIERRPIALGHRADRRIGACAHGDVVGMPVHAVRTPADDGLGTERRDPFPDPVGDLLPLDAFDPAIRVLPQLDPADGQRGSGLLQLRGADLRKVLAFGAARLARPAGLTPRGADQVHRNPGSAVSKDQSAATHRLVVGMRHHDQKTRLVFHQRPKIDRLGQAVLRSSISHAWSSACQAVRRAAYCTGHFSVRFGLSKASSIALRKARTAVLSRPSGCLKRTPIAFAYSASAPRTWSNIASRSRPPPRGPLRRAEGALATTVSRYVQHAWTRSLILFASVPVIGRDSSWAGLPGAP